MNEKNLMSGVSFNLEITVFFFLYAGLGLKTMEIGTIMKDLVEESKIPSYFLFYFNGTVSVRGLAWSRFDHSLLEPARLAEGESVLYIPLYGNIISIFILLLFKSTH